MAKVGRPMSDNPKKSKITVRMTDKEYEQLKLKSKENGLTVLDYVREAITDKHDRR